MLVAVWAIYSSYASQENVAGTGDPVKGSIGMRSRARRTMIVVLGHSNCGAVKAAIQHIDKRDSLPGAIDDLVELIKPAVQQVRAETGDKLDNAIRANVARGVERLKSLGPIIAQSVNTGAVKVAGGVYDLSTGYVTLISPG
jgi:carbonic anhydrase